MADQSARLFLCACCRIQVLVCRQCDRGQRYCAGACAATRRQVLQRGAGRRYQRSRAGRFKHAARTRRWRARQVPPAKIVTHQGSHDLPQDALLPATPTIAVATALASTDQACTIAPTAATAATTTTATIATTTILVPLAAPVLVGAWRCHWCATPCAALVRQGFLRRSHSQIPHHGHSP